MKLKVIMDSGKEYTVEVPGEGPEIFVNSFYNENKLPGGGPIVGVMKNFFMYLDEKTLFNPSHVSSIQILDN